MEPQITDPFDNLVPRNIMEEVKEVAKEIFRNQEEEKENEGRDNIPAAQREGLPSQEIMPTVAMEQQQNIEEQ